MMIHVPQLYDWGQSPLKDKNLKTYVQAKPDIYLLSPHSTGSGLGADCWMKITLAHPLTISIFWRFVQSAWWYDEAGVTVTAITGSKPGVRHRVVGVIWVSPPSLSSVCTPLLPPSTLDTCTFIWSLIIDDKSLPHKLQWSFTRLLIFKIELSSESPTRWLTGSAAMTPVLYGARAGFTERSR